VGVLKRGKIAFILCHLGLSLTRGITIVTKSYTPPRDTFSPAHLPPLAPVHLLSGSRLVYGLGICIVLLVIKHPLRTKSPTTGWNSQKVPAPTVPSGKSCRIHPLFTQYAISAAILKLVGIGVPSKYLLFPLASLGTLATVMLKRARRVRPQRTKKVRKTWSAGVRRPIAKAAAAGERPKETLWRSN
jgi:hypothetical protein